MNMNNFNDDTAYQSDPEVSDHIRNEWANLSDGASWPAQEAPDVDSQQIEPSRQLSYMPEYTTEYMEDHWEELGPAGEWRDGSLDNLVPVWYNAPNPFVDFPDFENPFAFGHNVYMKFDTALAYITVMQRVYKKLVNMKKSKKKALRRQKNKDNGSDDQENQKKENKRVISENTKKYIYMKGGSSPVFLNYLLRKYPISCLRCKSPGGLSPRVDHPPLFQPEGNFKQKIQKVFKSPRKSDNKRVINKAMLVKCKHEDKELERVISKLREAKLHLRYGPEIGLTINSVDLGENSKGILETIMEFLKSLPNFSAIKIEHNVNFGIQDMFLSLWKWIKDSVKAIGAYIKSIMMVIVGCLPAKMISMYNAFFLLVDPTFIVKMETDVIFDIDDPEFQPEAFPSMLPVSFFSTIWHGCLQGSSPIVSKENWMAFGDAVAAYKKDVNTISSFFSVIWNVLKEVTVFTCDIFHLDLTYFSPNTRVRAISDKAKAIREKYKAGEELGYSFAEEVFILEDEIESVLLMKTDLSPFVKERLQFLHNKMRPIIDYCTRNVNPNDGPRVEPLCVFIAGLTGAGKSSITQPFLMAFLSKVLEGKVLEDFMKKGGQNDVIFYRNTENEFWEGYKRNKIAIVYDDFGQARDDKGLSIDAFEFIRLINTAPNHLHFASMDQKATEYARPKLVFATSNRKKFDFQSIHCPEAVARRIHIGVVQCPRREFSIDPTKRACDRTLDVRKIRDKYPLHVDDPDTYLALDVLEFVEWDFAQGVPADSGRVWSFKELLRHALALQAELKVRGDHMLAFHERMKDYKVDEDAPATTVEDQQPPDMYPCHGGEYAPEMFGLMEQFKVAGARVIRAINEYNTAKFNEADERALREARALFWENAGTVPPIKHRFSEALFSFDGYMENRCAFQDETYSKVARELVFRTHRKSDDTPLFARKEWESLPMRTGDSLTFMRKLAMWLDLVCEERCIKYNIDPTEGHRWKSDIVSGLKVAAGFAAATFAMYKLVGFVRSACTSVSEFLPERAYSKREVANKGKKGAKKRATMTRAQRRSEKFNARATFDAEASATDMKAAFSTHMRNTYVISVRGKPLGSVLFFANRHFIMPRHFHDHICSLEDEEPLDDETDWSEMVEFRNPSCDTVSFVVDYNRDVENRALEKYDLVMCAILGEKCRLHKNILHLFMTNKEAGRSDQYLDGQMIVNRSNRLVGLTFRVRLGVSVQYGAGKEYSSRGLEYKTSSLLGDCGSFIMIDDTRFTGPRIMGIHTAGEVNKTGFKNCAGVLVVREELESYFNGTRDIDDIDLVDEELPQFDPECAIKLPGFANIGVAKQPLQASRTKIVPSEMQGDLWYLTTKPAHLRPFRVDDVLIDPGDLAALKYSHDEVYIDSDALHEVAHLVGNTVLAKVAAAPHDPRIYTFEEAVAGVDGLEYVDAIVRSTSPGYPFVHERGKFPGKSKWLGSEGPIDFDNPYCIQLRERVEFVISEALAGRRLNHVYIDFLKDERKPIAKVDIGKSRQIAAAPMDLALAMKMYFGDFVRHVTAERIRNGIALGIDHNTEWSDLVHHLMPNPKYGFVAGDYSCYDGRIPVPIANTALSIINDFYGNDPHGNRVRKILFQDIINSRHLRKGVVYERCGGNPSGQGLTTTFNSLCGLLIIHYVCYMKLRSDSPEIDYGDLYKLVRVIVYGDDIEIGVPTEWGHIFGQVVLEETIPRYVGMKYTSETKGEDGTTPNLRRLEDTNFLKRGYRKEGSKWYAPLELSVVKETLSWKRSSSTLDEMYLRIESTLSELAAHGKGVYNECAPVIVTASLKHYDYTPLNRTYHVALRSEDSLGVF